MNFSNLPEIYIWTYIYIYFYLITSEKGRFLQFYSIINLQKEKVRKCFKYMPCNWIKMIGFEIYVSIACNCGLCLHFYSNIYKSFINTSTGVACLALVGLNIPNMKEIFSWMGKLFQIYVINSWGKKEAVLCMLPFNIWHFVFWRLP